MTELSLEQFSERLAGKESVPGGGGAAALCGALGIALSEMVGNFTLGKKKYADVEEDIKALMREAAELRSTFLNLIEEDAKAFEPLSKAYSIPKDDPGRAALMEEATMTATRPPLEMVRACGRSIRILREMQLKGSVMLISDAGCGAAVCRAAMHSAAMNVFINTKTLVDRSVADAIDEEVDGLLKEYIPLADRIVSEVMEKLR